MYEMVSADPSVRQQLNRYEKRKFEMPPRNRQIGQGVETLERRELLTSVPFGASSQDTAEFLLGDVTVNVVFLESNGAVDASTEDWNADLATEVKVKIEEGVLWWSDTLAQYTDVHKLNFNFDYQYADEPVPISYEPISRPSQDVSLWIEEFFRTVDVPSATGFSTEIREFNHQQRLKHDTNWSFTIFVVNAENDPNGRFGNANASNTDFSRAFAYTGGRFIVMPHSRPASTVAHELAHMFWAHDEYTGSDPYTATRGYYATQNTNAGTGHPDPSSREPSLLISTAAPYLDQAISQSGRETMGWRDSDGDGIFDVLDVEHAISGEMTFDETTRTVRFVGSSSVQTLENRNTAGTQNDMTINRITDLQFRFEDGPWQDLVEFDGYQVIVDATTPAVPVGTNRVSFRTIDDRINVTSPTMSLELEDITGTLQNPTNRFDVNGDTFVSPSDVLALVRAINDGSSDTLASGPPYYDVSGDGVVSPRDVLALVRHINDSLAAPPTDDDSVAPPPPVVAASDTFSPSGADQIFALLSSNRNNEDDMELGLGVVDS